MRLSNTLVACALSVLLASRAWAALTHRYSFNDGTAGDSVGTAHGVLGGLWQRIVDVGNNSTGRELRPGDTATGYFGIGFIMLTPNNRFSNPIAQISINSSGGAADTDLVGTTTILPRNVEHHIVFTHDPTTRRLESMYIDGVLRGTGTARVDPSVTNYANYWIGRSNFQADPFYNGTINELRIYDHALSARDATQNWHLGPNVVPEPGAASLLLLGAALPLLSRRRR